MATSATIDDLIRIRLKRIRLARGLKSKDVAKLAGMPPSSYAAIENGQNALKVSRLQTVLEALEIDISDVWPWESLDSLLAAQRKAQLRIQAFRLNDVAELLGANGAVLLTREPGGEWKPLLSAGIDDDSLPLRISFCVLEEPRATIVTVKSREFCFVPVPASQSPVSRHLVEHMVERIAGELASDPVLLSAAIERQAQS